VAASDPESVRLAALAALRRWALQRDRLAGERAQSFTTAWRHGARNIRELAALADVSRDTVYSDLQGAGIDPTDRTRPVTSPRYVPLQHATVADLAETMSAQLKPAMLTESPDPFATAAWQLMMGMQRIAEVLNPDPPPYDPATAANPAATPSGYGSPTPVELLADLAYRGQLVVGAAHQALAGMLTADQVARREANDSVTAIDLGDPYIDAARMTVSLPNGRPIVVALRTAVDDGPVGRTADPAGAAGSGGATGWTWHSDSQWLADPAGPEDQLAARLDIGAAMHVIAEALRPSLTSDAYNEEL
jgi:hypothetical protein